MLVYVSTFGYSFQNNKGRFISPKSLGHFNSHLTANSLVQIKPSPSYYSIFLMKENNVLTNNNEWKEKNKYIYLDSSTQVKFGSYDQRPSAVNSKILKVFMLRLEIAEQLLKTNALYLSKFEYKDISLIIKPEFYKDFKYEFKPVIINLPTSTVPKQSTIKVEIVKTASGLLQKPIRKVAV